MSRRADRLKDLPDGSATPPVWSVQVELPAALLDDALLDDADELAASVSAFVAARDDDNEPVRWRLELLFEAEPGARELAAVADLLGLRGLDRVELSPRRLATEDWLAVARAHAVPTRAGRFFVHGAHRRDAVPPGAVGIEIEAGLAFGSGDHPSTQGCLVAIDRLARRRRWRRVLDLGCGSGVLGIAAAKCWASRVLCVDSDPVAVAVSRENARLNGVTAMLDVAVSEGYGASPVRRRRPFDLILANILANPLIGLARETVASLAPGGAVVLSGILDRQAMAVRAAHVTEGLHVREIISLDGWSTLVMTRPSRRTTARPAAPKLSGFG